MGNGFLINFCIAIIKAVAQGTLSCSVTTGSCSDDEVVFRMSSIDNAHAAFYDTSNPSKLSSQSLLYWSYLHNKDMLSNQ